MHESCTRVTNRQPELSVPGYFLSRLRAQFSNFSCFSTANVRGERGFYRQIITDWRFDSAETKRNPPSLSSTFYGWKQAKWLIYYIKLSSSVFVAVEEEKNNRKCTRIARQHDKANMAVWHSIAVHLQINRTFSRSTNVRKSANFLCIFSIII